MNKVSIIIVNYNSGNYLQRCLKSILSSVEVLYEIIVVDNASTDDSIVQCQGLKDKGNVSIFKLNENLGFAKANNWGASKSTGNLLHFLNPDTEVNERINDDYKTCYNNPNNIFINKLINPDGSFVKSQHIIITLNNMFNYFFNRKKVAHWYTGASIIISKNDFELIGKWNESFFMYAEDLDLFYKAFKHHIGSRWLNSTIFHVGGGSSSKVWTNLEREIRVQRSFKTFYRINNMKFQYVFYKIVVFLIALSKDYRKAILLIKAWKRI